MTVIAMPGMFYQFLRRAIVPVVLLLLLFLFGPPLTGEGASRVNSEISRIMKERTAIEQNLSILKLQLKEYQSKLTSTTRKESQSFKALENIRTQILVLEKMISENQNHLNKLDREIDRLQHELEGNRQIYGRVSEDFRRTAVSVYKYGGTRDIEHFFASGSVNKALVRAQYMGFFTRAVHQNVDELQKVAVKLEHNRMALEQSYKQKAAMVREQEEQLKSWSASKKEKESVLEHLKKNKQEYAAQLAAVQKKRAQLQSRIESLILAEQRAVELERARQLKIFEAKRRQTQRVEARLREAKRQEARRRGEAERLEARRRETQQEKPSMPEAVTAKKERKIPEQTETKTPEKQSVVTPADAGLHELEKVSADFDKAFGSLPWPVRNGVVAQKFGSVMDKDLKIVTTNNGIDITVPANTQVRAVSGGKVVQIAFLPTFGNVVIIRHPNSYLTVYANLGQLHVAKDDLIKSQQLVGLSGKMAEGGSVVHFEIWKGRVKQNPENWLKR
ncbi:MAG: peptidoglycan DD-metalloendopeptidase family protein [Chlorobiaceae bacterium]|nr:peptidoglycan DD-metalloendopeptidase family protein [Chlorobiaceae bacterium]